MRRSSITATFKADIETVWNVVTDNEHYQWRSDLAEVEIQGDGIEFVEHTRDGYRIRFHITQKVPYRQYEFDMENKNFTGHWTGSFAGTDNGGTKIEFTEVLYIKNPLVEILSYLFMNLKRMQETYVNDLRKALNE